MESLSLFKGNCYCPQQAQLQNEHCPQDHDRKDRYFSLEPFIDIIARSMLKEKAKHQTNLHIQAVSTTNKTKGMKSPTDIRRSCPKHRD